LENNIACIRRKHSPEIAINWIEKWVKAGCKHDILPLLRIKEFKKKMKLWNKRRTFNFGPTRFIRYLTFENGILTEINTGKRGY